MFHLGGPGCKKGAGILRANEMLPNVSEGEPTISFLWSRIPIVGLPPRLDYPGRKDRKQDGRGYGSS